MRIHTRYGRDLLKSVLFIILITLVSFTILLSYILIATNDFVSTTNRRFVSFFSESIDKQLLEIQKYSRTLELHPTSLMLKEAKEPITKVNESMYAFFDQMNSTKLIYSSIDRIMAFFPYSGICISDAGAGSIEAFQDLEEHTTQRAFPFVLEQLLNTESDYISFEYRGEKLLASLNTIKTNGETRGLIIIFLNLDAFLDAVDFPADNQRFSILYDGKVIRSTASPLTAKDNNPLLTFSQDSRISPLISYTYEASFSSFYKPLLALLRISIFCTIAIFILSTVLSIRFSRKNSSQIGSLLGTFGEDPNDEKAIEAISENITKLLKEKDLSLEQIQIRQSTIEGLFLNLMIADEGVSEQAAMQAAIRYGLNFDSPYFAIAVIKSINSPDNLRQKMLASVSQSSSDVLITFRSGVYALLFNMEEKDSDDEISHMLCLLKKEVFSSFLFTAAIGPHCNKLTEIRSSFQAAVSILESNPIKSSSEIMICNRQDCTKESEMMEFTGLLAQKKYEKAVAKLTAENCVAAATLIRKEVARLQEMKCIAPDLVLVPDHIKPGEDSVKILRDILSLIAEAKPDRQTLSTAGKAKDIVDNEFTDPTLGLYAIAEKLGVTNSYLSATFKDSYGIGINHYINKQRIDMAKDLITTTDLSIKDIAFSTGFLSDISFIRVFKKFEATTPTKLREKGK